MNFITPVEQYSVNGHNILVKRDDLFMADSQPFSPPLAKLRGAFPLLQDLKRYDHITRVAAFDTRISKAGQGIAFLCKELGLECLVGFPQLKGKEPSESQKIAGQLGAELCPLKAGRTAVCYYTFKKIAEQRGYLMMPLGLVCRQTVLAVAQEAARTLKELEQGGVKVKTIVVCTGTGTIATGIHLGADAKVIGVSCGMSVAKQVQRMRELAFPKLLNWNFLELIEPEYEYYTALDTSKCPFPTSPYYDMKAYTWMLNNVDRLESPCMFWNIGV